MATISKVRIANMALSHVGTKSTIESLTEDSAEAHECDLWYDYCRLQALEAYDWNFARKRQTLALHSDDPPEGVWGFRYQYPADCVALRNIVNPLGPDADAIPFEVEMNDTGETKTILTDMEDAVMAYTFNQSVTVMYSPFFVMTFSYLLAHHIAFSLTGKTKIRDTMIGIYDNLILTAPAHNANERVGKPPRDADWIRGRS